MKKYLVIVVLVFMFCFMSSVKGLTFQSIEGDTLSNIGTANTFLTCGPYYDFNKNIFINKNGAFFGLPSVLFLKFPRNEGESYYYVYSLNTGTAEILQSEYKNLPNGFIKPLQEESCPLYIEDESSKFVESTVSQYKGFYFADIDKLSFKMYNKSTEKGNGEIFKLIEENHLLQCTYDIANNRKIDLFYSSGVDDNNNDYYLIIPDNRKNGGHYGEDAILIDKGLAKAWYNNGIKPIEQTCPCVEGKAEIMSNANIAADKFNYSNIFKSTDSSTACGEANAGVSICAFYDDLIAQIKSDYENASTCDKSKNEYCNVNYILDADKYISELNEGCSQVFKTLNAGDSCVDKCLELSDVIKKLKNENGIEYIQSDCGLSARIIKFIANIFKWVKYIAPVLAIILGILDFIKAISSQSDDEMKKAQGKFVKRLIAAALLFIVPFGIEFILDKFNVAGDNPFCNLI